MCWYTQGVIAAEELLAPAYLVADAGDQEEGEEYVEVANINPAQYYKVGLIECLWRNLVLWYCAQLGNSHVVAGVGTLLLLG